MNKSEKETLANFFSTILAFLLVKFDGKSMGILIGYSGKILNLSANQQIKTNLFSSSLPELNFAAENIK